MDIEWSKNGSRCSTDSAGSADNPGPIRFTMERLSQSGLHPCETMKLEEDGMELEGRMKSE